MKRKASDLGILVALAIQARQRDGQNSATITAFQGSDEEREALERQLEAGVAADRARILAAAPRTLGDAAAQLVLLADRVADDEHAAVLARVARIVAEHAGVDLDAIGGDILLDPPEEEGAEAA